VLQRIFPRIDCRSRQNESGWGGEVVRWWGSEAAGWWDNGVEFFFCGDYAAKNHAEGGPRRRFAASRQLHLSLSAGLCYTNHAESSIRGGSSSFLTSRWR
jgi:hypothetical protein